MTAGSRNISKSSYCLTDFVGEGLWYLNCFSFSKIIRATWMFSSWYFSFIHKFLNKNCFVKVLLSRPTSDLTALYVAHSLKWVWHPWATPWSCTASAIFWLNETNLIESTARTPNFAIKEGPKAFSKLINYYS